MSEESKDRIRAAFVEKTPKIGPCFLCGTREWQLADGGFVTLSLLESPSQLVLGGSVLPSVAIVCRTCGNTALLNLFVLGLGDLAEEASEESDEAVPDESSTDAEAG